MHAHSLRIAVPLLAAAAALIGCSSGPEENGAEKPAQKAWEAAAAALEAGQGGEGGFEVFRRLVKGMNPADIGHFVNRLGASPAFLALLSGSHGPGPDSPGWGRDDGESASIERVRREMLYLRFGEDLAAVEITRALTGDPGRKTGLVETAEVSRAFLVHPDDLMDTGLARARLGSRDWRAASDPFEGTAKGDALRSQELAEISRLRFFRNLSAGDWTPEEKARALIAARYYSFRRAVDAREYPPESRKQAMEVRSSFEAWARGGESRGWRGLLKAAFARAADTELPASERLLGLMCLLSAAGHESGLPAEFSGPEMERNYASTLSAELVAEAVRAIESGSEGGAVAALAILSGVDAYLGLRIAETRRDSLLKALVGGLDCFSPVIRAGAAMEIERLTGCMLSEYDPFSEGAALDAMAARVKERFGRTGFQSSPEETARKSAEGRIRKILDTLAFVHARESAEGKGGFGIAAVVEAAGARRIAHGLFPAEDGGFKDRDGFVYSLSVLETGCVFEARGTLRPGEPCVVFFHDSTLGRTCVAPLENQR